MAIITAILFVIFLGCLLYLVIFIFPGSQLILNIVGGFIAAVMFAFSSQCLKKIYSILENFNFKRIFGSESDKNFSLVYSRLALRDNLFFRNEGGQYEPIYEENGRLKIYPYFKHGDPKRGLVRVYSVVPFAETKSAKYLSEIFGKVVRFAPNLLSDYETEGKQNISFCSIGGMNNYKTRELMGYEENQFFTLGEDSAIIVKAEKEKFIIEGKERERKRFCIEGSNNEYDHGLILKIKPNSYSQKAWIAIAGIGELGTSGAAWYLANNWKKMPKNQSFGIVVKVGSRDDSAREVIRIRPKNRLDKVVFSFKNLFQK